MYNIVYILNGGRKNDRRRARRGKSHSGVSAPHWRSDIRSYIMSNVIEFKCGRKRIDDLIGELEALHQQLDEIMDTWAELESIMQPKQELLDDLVDAWKDPVPVLWKMYTTNQILGDEDIE